MSEADLSAIWVTFKLASATTVCLLAIGTPISWLLARSQSIFKPPIEALVALPLVLPPTVLGFYFLVLLSPNSMIGGWILELTGETLTFSFSGLVFASVLYSLPFMVQPLQVAFEATDRRLFDSALSLGASPLSAFFSVVMPTCKRGFLTGTVLSFAHTVGEFGVVLMVGGNIPGETRVVSVAIYEHVETVSYADAHLLSACLIGFSFVVLLLVYGLNRSIPVGVR